MLLHEFEVANKSGYKYQLKKDWEVWKNDENQMFLKAVWG